MKIEWLGQVQFRRATLRPVVPLTPLAPLVPLRASLQPLLQPAPVPVPRAAPRFAETSRYTFVLVRILPDCRELTVWQEGPRELTQPQAEARWAQIIDGVTGVGQTPPGEGLQLRMLRNGERIALRVYVGGPSQCFPQTSALGQSQGPCPAGQVLVGTLCVPDFRNPPPPPVLVPPPTGTICAAGETYNAGYGRCIPVTCPQGTARDLRTGLCSGASTTCLTSQQVAAAAPCFFIDANGQYTGPPDLVQGANISQILSICLQSLQSGFFDQPLCDPSTMPLPPPCITPEHRTLLTYCAERGSQGDDPNANYFCWLAAKAPENVIRAWAATPLCAPGQTPPPSSVPTPPTQQPAATRTSPVVPLLIGAAVIGAAALLLSS